MKLSQDLKAEIQCFCYFLFKGTFSNELIFYNEDYLKFILNDSELLYKCFQIFANEKNHDFTKNPNKKVSDYIINRMKNCQEELIETEKLNDFWKNFLILSSRFCKNDFPNKVKKFKILDLYGVGTDAVSYFAVWTNVVEIDEKFNVINSDFALKRANERLLIWDNKMKITDFENWEVVQEIY